MASDDEGVAETSHSAATKESEDGVDFFRGKASVLQLLQEKKRRAKEKKQRLERRRSSQTVSVERADATVQSKRRRVSKDEDDEDEDLGSRAPSGSHRSTSPGTPRDRNSRSISAIKPIQGSPKTLSGKYSQLTDRESRSRRSQPTEVLISSDTDEDSRNPRSRSRNHPDAAEDDLNDGQDVKISNDTDSEDGDFTAILEAARAQAQRNKSLKSENKPPVLLSKEEEERRKKELLDARVRERLEQFKKTGSIAKSASESSAPIITPAVDPKITLFITSTIEGTKPLLFIITLSQRLRDVKHSWCARQDIEMSDIDRDSVFLTWKGTKMFDTSTCKSMLGSRVTTNGQINKSGEGFNNGQLHMEVWTPSTFRQHEAEKAAIDRQRHSQFQTEEEEEEEEPEPEAKAEPEVPKLRLTMKSKGMDDWKLIVKPHTKIAKMIHSFRESRGVEDGKEVVFRFDGEVLDEEVCVGDTELEDFDSIDVQIR